MHESEKPVPVDVETPDWRPEDVASAYASSDAD
jgi:hypothetical protein